VTLLALATGLQVAFGIMAALLLLAGVIYVVFGRDDDYSFDAVWKANGRGDSALNWGTLKVLDRRDQKVRTIPVENANRPSIGDRFVAFDEISRTHLSVYDPVTRTVLDLASGSKLGLEGDLAFGGESVSERLLAFSVGPAEASAPPRIGWAILPE